MTTYLKLIYLYLCYWVVGLTEEGFQYKKAWLLCDLGHYHAAIFALKKAEIEWKASYIFGLLGWCYIQIESFENALIYYNKAYTKDKSPTVVLGLAISEFYAGSTKKSEEFYQQLLPFCDDPYIKESMDMLKLEYEKASSS